MDPTTDQSYEIRSAREDEISLFDIKEKMIDDTQPPDLPGATLGLTMQTSFEGIGSFKSQLVGLDIGNCIIIKLPPIPTIATKLYEKNHAIVRYLHAGNVYGFRSTLIGIIKAPTHLYILDYPDTVDSLNVRKEERYACIIPARLKIPRKSDLHGFITDISVSGCRFECATSKISERPGFEIGQCIDFSFKFPDKKVWRELRSEIRIMKIDSAKMTIGFKYTPNETEEEQQALNDIASYINNLNSLTF